MELYQIDPTKDGRWEELVARHPMASVFHTTGWLQALRLSYGYEPMVFTTSPPTGKLNNGIVFCRISSWLTGCRMVSLPFSDHCEPLCDSTDELHFLIRYLQTALEHEKWRYLELRPIGGNLDHASNDIRLYSAVTHFIHTLDLCPDLHDVYRSLDKDCVQRRIRRAERGSLSERCGRSEDLLKEFYQLFVITRSRHHLPPIPYAWFRNLIKYQGKTLEVRLAYKDKIPISAILTLKFKNTVYFKYGCSDPRFKHFGATSWLLWRAIVAAKSNGATKFDMGRTASADKGLLQFKNHWVPQPMPLVYWRFPPDSSGNLVDGWKFNAAKRVFSWMPNRLLTIAGRVLYRHIG